MPGTFSIPFATQLIESYENVPEPLRLEGPVAHRR
jgi:hypothetical protein